MYSPLGDDGGLNTQSLTCPDCSHELRRKGLPDPTLIHWILNPGLAFNEIALGQSVPRALYVCETCAKPFTERVFVFCPSCKALHRNSVWSWRGAGFGHWLGYVCPACGQPIPRLWNVFSVLVLALTFPVWILPYVAFRERFLAWELRRVRTAEPIPLDPAKLKNTSLIWRGMAFFGIPMWVFMSSFGGCALGRIPTDQRPYPVWAFWLVSLPLWLGAGALWGFFMRKYLGRRPN